MLMTASGSGNNSGGFDGGGSNSGWGWLRPWVEAMGCRSGLRWGSRLLGWWVLWRFCGRFSLRFVPLVFFFFWVVGGWGCGWWWWLWQWLWPWLEVMSLKSLGHGGFESKYQREGEASPGWERWKDSGREK